MISKSYVYIPSHMISQRPKPQRLQIITWPPVKETVLLWWRAHISEIKACSPDGVVMAAEIQRSIKYISYLYKTHGPVSHTAFRGYSKQVHDYDASVYLLWALHTKVHTRIGWVKLSMQTQTQTCVANVQILFAVTQTAFIINLQFVQYCRSHSNIFSTITEILIGSKLFILRALIMNYSPFNIVLQNMISSPKNAAIFSFPYSRGIIH